MTPTAPRSTCAPCPICALADCPFHCAKDGYSIFRCPQCHLSFVHPRPSTAELMAIYQADYFERGDKYAAADPALDPNRKNDLTKLDLLARYCAQGRLLDVGSARGGFLQAARERGFGVQGVEPSEAAARYAAEKLGLDVIHADLPTAGLASEKFDLVTLWDVIEHLRDPVATLDEIRRVLRPGGFVALSTGDASSLAARLMGTRWHLLTPPQHLFFFEKKGLAKLLAAHGLEPVYTGHLAKRVSLGFILFKAGETFFPPARALFKMGKAAGVNAFELRVNLFDIQTVVARKV